MVSFFFLSKSEPLLFYGYLWKFQSFLAILWYSDTQKKTVDLKFLFVFKLQPFLFSDVAVPPIKVCSMFSSEVICPIPLPYLSCVLLVSFRLSSVSAAPQINVHPCLHLMAEGRDRRSSMCCPTPCDRYDTLHSHSAMQHLFSFKADHELFLLSEISSAVLLLEALSFSSNRLRFHYWRWFGFFNKRIQRKHLSSTFLTLPFLSSLFLFLFFLPCLFFVTKENVHDINPRGSITFFFPFEKPVSAALMLLEKMDMPPITLK